MPITPKTGSLFHAETQLSFSRSAQIDRCAGLRRHLTRTSRPSAICRSIERNSSVWRGRVLRQGSSKTGLSCFQCSSQTDQVCTALLAISIARLNSFADECRSQNGAARTPNFDGQAVAARERLKLPGNVGKRQPRLDLRGPLTGQIQAFFAGRIFSLRRTCARGRLHRDRLASDRLDALAARRAKSRDHGMAGGG